MKQSVSAFNKHFSKKYRISSVLRDRPPSEISGPNGWIKTSVDFHQGWVINTGHVLTSGLEWWLVLLSAFTFPCITQVLPLFQTPMTFHLFTLVAMEVTGTVPVLLKCEVYKNDRWLGVKLLKRWCLEKCLSVVFVHTLRVIVVQCCFGPHWCSLYWQKHLKRSSKYLLLCSTN